MKTFLMAVCAFFLLITPAAYAQDGDDCPAKVLLAMARAGSACQKLEADQACFGNGLVTATFQTSSSDFTLGAAGDRVPVSAVQALQIGGAADEWSVGLLQIRADLPAMEQRSVTLIAFGQVEIENQVPMIPEITVSATAVLYIRAEPSDSADILKEMGLRETVTANGRTADGQWLRVMIPGTTELGWVSTGVITTTGSITALNVVDENTPYSPPFQVSTLQTGVDDALCESAPESGLLIQTPNTDNPVTLAINGVWIHLAATVHLQAGETMVLSVLDGYAEIENGGAMVYVPAGARIVIPLDSTGLVSTGSSMSAEPYVLADLQGLPLNNPPYRLVLVEPLSQEMIDALAAEHFAPTPTPLPPEVIEQQQSCVRKLREDVSLWAGPGTYYEVVNTLPAGQRVRPVLETTDADGLVWWQLSNSGWVQARSVEATGDCSPVPLSDTASYPEYNHMSLETCMTTNGPIRPGQWVTMEFLPPGWDTVEEAIAAPGIPGQITVGTESLYVWASDPIKIAEDRYVVRFSGDWYAQVGTYRIVATRLSYTLICNLTVTLGR